MSGRKIIYKKGYLEGHLYGSSPSINAIENERNLINLTSTLDINTNYNSPFLKKGPVNIKIIK